MVRNDKIFLLLVCLWPLAAMNSLPVLENKPPEVSIKAPKAGEKIMAGGQLFYEIEVNDPEDGATAYQEINPKEVFLEVAYFKEEEKAGEYADGKHEAPELSLIQSGLCFNCHAANANLGAPSFSDISRKYAGQDIKTQLTGSIKSGSTGKWGNTAIMPANPQLDDARISQMADWIITLKDQPETFFLTGTSGTVNIEAGKKGSILVLKAGYRDHGNGEPGSELIGIDTQIHSIE